MNRLWTFGGTDGPLLREWAKFVSANMAGGAINYGVSAILAIAFPGIIGHYPVLAVAAGSLSGLTVNFGLSKRFVFGVLRRDSVVAAPDLRVAQFSVLARPSAVSMRRQFVTLWL